MAKSIFSGLKRAAPRLLARLGTGSEAMLATTPVHVPISPTQTVQSVPESHGREHVVKPGETLSAIARLYDIHVETLRFLNGIQSSDLAVGTKLQVPARSGEL
jgi:LysM repeat protein